MTIEKLERVMWRLREINKGADKATNAELERAIMYEIGTDPRTYKASRKALIKLGWLRGKGTKRLILTNKDIQES